MKKISPSMMCVEFDKLNEYLKVFEEGNIEYLHIDIMDGTYVPNFTLGTDYVKQLRKKTNIPLDVHFMIDKPDDKLEWFDFQPGEYVSVHPETTIHLQKTLRTIRSYGAKAMVALSPPATVESLRYVLDDMDGLLVMTVNPGFAGQKVIPQTIQKIEDCRKYLDARGYRHIEIEVDGNVSYELAAEMTKKHADIFVAGTSSFMGRLEEIPKGIKRMRNAIDEV